MFFFNCAKYNIAFILVFVMSCSKEVNPLLSPLSLFAAEIRRLSAAALKTSQSGHAGLPFGCAEIGAYLFGHFLRLDPAYPTWDGRDRFVLSAGHGSLLLYTALHLLGFPIDKSDLFRYRQFGSNTPSHPDVRRTVGIEATTGLDGQGIGYAAGLALGMKINQARFDAALYDAKCLALAGDGCFMEGVSSECSSLAGHLQLDNLIVLYDANRTSLDGYTSETFSEEVASRYRAYNWDVVTIDGHSFAALHQVLTQLRQGQQRPTLIIAETLTGKGLTSVEGTPKAHGCPSHALEEHDLTPPTDSTSLTSFLSQRKEELKHLSMQWREQYTSWTCAHPARAQELAQSSQPLSPLFLENALSRLPLPSTLTGRAASHAVFNHLARFLPDLYCGSADLSRSDKTYLEGSSSLAHAHFLGRNIKFGVREFGMCTLAIGMALTRLLRPVIGTFLAFSDYMTSGIRMAALMGQKVIFHFTHDSFLIGHDGPTHQPVEHIAHLRAMPGLWVIRPADPHEIKCAWIAALTLNGPVALIIARQDLPTLNGTQRPYSDGLAKGGYILEEDAPSVDVLLIATGSEVHLATLIANKLRQRGYAIRLVSLPCQELFDRQSASYRDKLLKNAAQAVSLEAGAAQGWHKYVGQDGLVISVDSFGESGAPEELRNHYTFTVDKSVQAICARTQSCPSLS